MRNATFPWHKLKDALLRGVDVTHPWAYDRGMGWRLSGKIYQLRKEGWPIVTTRDSKCCAHYSLPQGWTLKDLKKSPGGTTGAQTTNERIQSTPDTKKVLHPSNVVRLPNTKKASIE